MWDLHRPEILPYREDKTKARGHGSNATTSTTTSESTPTIEQGSMDSGKPDLADKDAANRECQIYPDEMRYRMLHENPATVCMWFFIRQMINMEVMRECSYPKAYTKWYARKFEFQDRGSVHEHNVKALIFLWIKAEHKDTEADQLTEDDFEEVTCRADKLSMYCESGMVRQIMIRRIYNQIKMYSKLSPTVNVLDNYLSHLPTNIDYYWNVPATRLC